jgi:hypothetical protein
MNIWLTAVLPVVSALLGVLIANRASRQREATARAGDENQAATGESSQTASAAVCYFFNGTPFCLAAVFLRLFGEVTGMTTVSAASPRSANS